MDDDSIKRLLLNLKDEDAFALYESRCLKKTMFTIEKENPQQGRRIFHKGMSAGTASNKSINALRYLREEDIAYNSDYCRILTELVGLLGNPPDWTKWPPEVPIEEPPLIPSIQPTTPIIDPQPRRRETLNIRELIDRLNLSPRTVGMGALLLAFLFGLWLVFQTLGGENIVSGEEPRETTQEILTTRRVSPTRLVSTSKPTNTPAPSLTPLPPAAISGTSIASMNMTRMSSFETANPTTPTATATATATATNTPTSTPTTAVLQVTNGVLSDDRVRLEILEWRLEYFKNQHWIRVNYAVGILMSFTNNSGGNIFFGINDVNFTLTDNEGNAYICSFPIAIHELSQELATGAKYDFWVSCGRDGKIPNSANQLFLRVKEVSSLPEAEFLWSIPR